MKICSFILLDERKKMALFFYPSKIAFSLQTSLYRPGCDICHSNVFELHLGVIDKPQKVEHFHLGSFHLR